MVVEYMFKYIVMMLRQKAAKEKSRSQGYPLP